MPFPLIVWSVLQVTIERRDTSSRVTADRATEYHWSTPRVPPEYPGSAMEYHWQAIRASPMAPLAPAARLPLAAPEAAAPRGEKAENCEPDVRLHWALSQPSAGAPGEGGGSEEPSGVQLSVSIKRASTGDHGADGHQLTSRSEAAGQAPVDAAFVAASGATPAPTRPCAQTGPSPAGGFTAQHETPSRRANPSRRGVQTEDIGEFARRVKEAGSVDLLRAADPAFVHKFRSQLSLQLRQASPL